MRARVEALCAAGVHVVVVSGKDVGDLDKQLGARPDGPGQLLLCVNRGSEVVEVTGDGPVPMWRRGLPDPRVTSDRNHVGVGLTDESDSVRWAAGWLAARGSPAAWS